MDLAENFEAFSDICTTIECDALINRKYLHKAISIK